MEAGLWTIPPGALKARRAYRVPLTDPVLAVLREVQGAHVEWLFSPGQACADRSATWRYWIF